MKKVYSCILFILVMHQNAFTRKLIDKYSLPCDKVTLLQPQEISQLMKELDEWQINDAGHLYKEYKFSYFISAMNFANKITEIAEADKHHPDLIVSWGKCKVEIWHYVAKGLTENDFILAAKIDYERRPMKTYLLDKNCVPFQKTKLQPEEISELKKGLEGSWEINDSGHLYKEYKFSDFISAMNFANKVKEVAEREWHHPDLTISWGKCKVEMWTHAADGLTENDFILAAKIDYESR